MIPPSRKNTTEILYALKREVDFIVIKDNRPLALFEAKEEDEAISPSGKYFAKKIGIPFYQISPHHTRVEAFP
jgi:uncharacterized protein